MSAATYTTLSGPAQHSVTIKESVFQAYAARADSPDEALAFLRALLTEHPNASHLCWAYRIGNQYRFSDDGEPGGTAGQPILRAIEGQGLDHVVAGVVRYFGGTKLGAGGLVRAYGGSVAETLRTAPRAVQVPRTTLTLSVGFDATGPIYRILESYAAQRLSENYTEQGLDIVLSLPLHERDKLETALRDATRGQYRLAED